MRGKFKVKSCKQTSTACPSQWDIYTTDGKYIYARYRWGYLSLTLNWGTDDRQVILGQNVRDGLDGYMKTAELIKLTSSILDWSVYKSYTMKASKYKCCICGKQAVAFWPMIDPDIPAKPYCRKCLDKAKIQVLMNCFGKSEKEAEQFVNSLNKQTQ